jgi:hypothetical protein
MRKVEHKLAFYPTSPIPNACREILEMGSHIRNTQINLVFHSAYTIFARILDEYIHLDVLYINYLR